MIINKEEVEEFIKNLLTGDFEDIHIDYGVRKGVEFAEEYVYKYTSDLVIENQGLKLYKDGEAERSKKFAVEFGEWILQNDNPGFKLVFGDGLPNKWGSVRQGGGYSTTEELYELFLKERNEKI